MKNLYRTTDLDTAVVLLTAEFPISEIRPISNARFEFCFEKHPSLNRILEVFWRQQLNLPAHALLANLKFLKTRVKECR